MKPNKLIFFAGLLLLGCSTQQMRKTIPVETPSTAPLPSTTQTPPPTEPQPSEATTEPEPLPKKIPNIALVFGGAGVSSLATVGILKAFREKQIPIQLIITTGWPSLFSAAFERLSIHDLEWQAMRLSEKNFYSISLFELKKGYSTHEPLSETLSKFYKNEDLSQNKIPTIVTATELNSLETHLWQSGQLQSILLNTLSTPGFHRAFQNQGEWVLSLRGLDIEPALDKEMVVVSFDMFSDYLNHLSQTRKDNSEGLFKKFYLELLRKNIQNALNRSHIKKNITLKVPPNNFSYNRLAIQTGYQVGMSAIKEIQSLQQ